MRLDVQDKGTDRSRSLRNSAERFGARGHQPRAHIGSTHRHRPRRNKSFIGGIAEFEREPIRARTGDGIRRAKAAGDHMGQPPKLTKHQQREVLARLDRGETLTDIARSYAVNHMTISRIKAQYTAA
jgi:DNA invertase Pin-like site-specific DNA recombinase